MEKNELPVEDKKIIQDNWVPTPPTPDGVWRNKGRDHDFFQEKVSLAAQLGGVSSTAGCPTDSAETARQAAEERFYRSQEKHPKKILEKNKI